MMKVTKVQTETMWEVEYGDTIFSVMQIEDCNFESGHYSWEVWDEDTNLVTNEELESEIIMSIIESL
jgi:hypothetical protein